MKLTRRFTAACGAIACLALGACHTGRDADDSTASSSPIAPVDAAGQEFGTYELCVAYPVPDGFNWSRATLEAFCADEFTLALTRNEIGKFIDAGQGKALDTELEAILQRYLAGELPEGTARYAYQRFDRADDATGELIERWLAQSPGSPHALAARGIHRVARGQEARGEKLIRDTPPENLSRMSDELDLAKADLERALEANGKIFRAHEALIDAARMEGPRVLGTRALESALRTDPKNFYVRAAYMGMTYPQWGGSFEAMDRLAADAQRWVAQNPRLVNLRSLALSARGFEDYTGRNDKQALRAYERGLVEGPVHINLHIAAVIAYRLGQQQRAAELFSQMLRFSPEHADARVYRARCYTDLENYAQAAKDLDTALALDANNLYALRQYAALLLKQKRYQDAVERLERARTADPADRWVLQTLAHTYLYRTRSFKQADPLVAELLTSDPKNGAAWLMRADVIQNLGTGDLREAAERFVRYADPSVEEQRIALPKVKAWLADNAAR